MNLISFLFSILVFISGIIQAHAYLADPLTTKLQSTSGAGVATLHMTESTLLNPASVVFFNQSAFSYQRETTSLEEESKSRSDSYQSSGTDIISLIDTSSSLHGGYTYQYQNGEDGYRKRYSISLAAAISKDAGLGLIYRYTDEDSSVIDDSYSQVVLGFTKVISNKLLIGFTIVDPNQEVSDYFKYTGGIHLTVNDFFDVIADIGSGDVHNKDKESFTAWALQISSFESLYLRYGQFHNKLENRKGTSWGISWVGPKLSLEYSYKISELISNSSDTLLLTEELHTNSLSLTMIF